MEAGEHDPSGNPAWFEFGRALVAAHEIDAPPEQAASRERALTKARANLHHALDGNDAFAALVANATLPLDDAEVLAFLTTAETDPLVQLQIAQLHAIPSRVRPTLGTLSQLFGPDHRGPLAVANDAPLRRAAFVDVATDTAWASQTVALQSTVIWALLGDASRDPDLPRRSRHFDDDPSLGGLPEELDDLVSSVGAHDFLIVTGADPLRRRQVGARIAPGNRFLHFEAPEADTEWAAMVREATITGRGLLVDVNDSLPAAGRYWIERADHLVWVLCGRSGPPLDELPRRPWTEVTAPSDPPTDSEWTRVLGPDADRSHPLTPTQLELVAPAHGALGGDLDSAVRRLASGHLDQLTQRIRPTRSWEDLVVSPDRRDLLRSIVDRYRHASRVYDTWGFAPTPSRGLVSLFSGPSGTGKTLAAEIIAGDLGLDLFKLDLSSVVSKYIGETEKNLEQIFDAASAGNLVLFFDEADSLFGKRSEVKDARDRYANIEVSYLLQRLETYDGLVVMATNFEKNIDEAFLRRIHIRVAFSMPGAEERAAIWSRNLPPRAPVEGLDTDWLAEHFEISGAAIRNAAIQAAFAAAADDGPITMDRAVLGVAREYRKMGRLVKKDDFGDYTDLVGG